MKKLVLIFFLMHVCRPVYSQILLDNVYQGAGYSLFIDKFHVSGYKYVKVDIPNLKIEIYNINHSLFKTISIPSQTLQIQSVLFVSEQLFDTDNLVEYAINTYTSISNPSPGFPSTNQYKFRIYKENGTLLMSRDSASLNGTQSDIFANGAGIFFDGQNTKMKLIIFNQLGFAGSPIKNEIYTLPGSIPCEECSSTGTVSGIVSAGNPGGSNPVFYPNPVTDQLKLKYDLPKDYKNAEINVYDLQGKLIETFKVTNTFDFIYLPSDFNNGLYLYQLNVDGKTVKTEKIILNK